MMMSAGAVNVAVLQFFRRRFANADDLNVEVKRLVSQGMVPVERDHIADHGRYGKQAHAIVGPRLELHALFDIPGAL